jgi:hypothetical protein
VVLERSSAEGADTEERRTSALFSLVKQLQGINHRQPEQKYDWKKQAHSRADAFQAWYPPTTFQAWFPVLPSYSIASSTSSKAIIAPGKNSSSQPVHRCMFVLFPIAHLDLTVQYRVSMWQMQMSTY